MAPELSMSAVPGSSGDGARVLSAADARARLACGGANVLPSPRPPAAWRQLATQMGHFFALMLWVAGVLAFVADLPQLGVAIFVVVVVNGVFAFVQESRAEHAAERLRDLMPRRAMVLRDGAPVEIDAAELVVDDLVLLTAGDRVSADLRVTEAHQLVMARRSSPAKASRSSLQRTMRSSRARSWWKGKDGRWSRPPARRRVWLPSPS